MTDAIRNGIPGVNCSLCGDSVPENSGVYANCRENKNKSLTLCSGCLRIMVRALEGIEPIDMVEVGGVFYTPTDKPLPPPINVMRKPNVIYDARPAPEPKEQEPLKYNPKIPPRRRPG